MFQRIFELTIPDKFYSFLRDGDYTFKQNYEGECRKFFTGVRCVNEWVVSLYINQVFRRTNVKFISEKQINYPGEEIMNVLTFSARGNEVGITKRIEVTKEEINEIIENAKQMDKLGKWVDLVRDEIKPKKRKCKKRRKRKNKKRKKKKIVEDIEDLEDELIVY